MRRYINIYKAILSINLSQFFVYRADSLWIGVITSSLWASFNVFAMYLVTQKINGAYGYSAGQLVLIASVYNIIIGIFGMFVTKSINEFPEIVDKGRLDHFLLKPLNSQLYLSTHTIELRYITRTILGILFSVLIIQSYGIQITQINVILFTFSILFAMILLYSCLFILNTFIIWSPNTDNINEMFYTLRSVGRYPREIFTQVNVFFFMFFAPFVIVIDTPAKILMGKASLFKMGELVFASLIMLVISHLFWKFALKHYTGASS